MQLLGKTSLGALWLLVILAAVYYFLAEWPRLRNGFIDSFPYEYRSELNELYMRVRSIWMNYLRGQLLLMAIVGVTFTIAWTIIGIPGALVLGVVAGFLTLIPDVGPFLAAMLAVAVALIEGSNWSWMPASSDRRCHHYTGDLSPVDHSSRISGCGHSLWAGRSTCTKRWF